MSLPWMQLKEGEGEEAMICSSGRIHKGRLIYRLWPAPQTIP